MAGDRLSALHDSLLCSHILSKLPLRDAVRCSILSRRWRSIWTLLPHLRFLNADVTEKVIDNMMCFHHGDLESLEISVSYWYLRYGNWSPNGELIRKSVLAASVKRVKQITLNLPISLHIPTSLFSCDCLTFLDLTRFEFKLPSSFSGFRYLRTCFLTDVHIIDDMLEQLAAKCPLLKKLRVLSCSMRLNNLKISAPSLKYFNFSGNRHEKSLTLTVNCPKLRIVTIHNCPSRLKLELNSCRELHFSTTELHVLKGLSNKSSVKKITLRGLSTHVPSLAVLSHFSNLEELSLESDSFEGANPATRSLTLPLMTNLKNVRIRVSGLDEEIALIGCLLRNAPSLQTMTVTLPTCSGYVHQKSFLEQIFRLNRSSGQATVHITANGWDMCKTCLASSLYEERSSSDEEATTSTSDDDEDTISADDDEEDTTYSDDD